MPISSLNYFGSDGVLLPAIGLTLLVGIVSGLYPAFFLSRFQPAQVLKANRSAAETPGSGRLRAAWSSLQFAVSIGLIICTAVVYAQTVYARTVDPGYKRDHILQVENIGRRQLLGRSRDDRRSDEADSRCPCGRTVRTSASQPKTTATPACSRREQPRTSKSATIRSTTDSSTPWA